MTPNQASKGDNDGLVYYNLYHVKQRNLSKSKKRPKVKKGDKVRILRYKKSLQRGMQRNGLMSSLL